jgi:hypothetical protein
MNTVFTAEILEAEMQPSYMGPELHGKSMTFIGRGIAKTIGGAIREARKNFEANEQRSRDAFCAEFGTDNGTPIYGHFKVMKNGVTIINKG